MVLIFFTHFQGSLYKNTAFFCWFGFWNLKFDNFFDLFFPYFTHICKVPPFPLIQSLWPWIKIWKSNILFNRYQMKYDNSTWEIRFLQWHSLPSIRFEDFGNTWLVLFKVIRIIVHIYFIEMLQGMATKRRQTLQHLNEKYTDYRIWIYLS